MGCGCGGGARAMNPRTSQAARAQTVSRHSPQQVATPMRPPAAYQAAQLVQSQAMIGRKSNAPQRRQV